MGNSSSKHKPNAEEIEDLENNTHFSAPEVEKLWAAFIKIANKDSKDGKISPKEFMDALNIKNAQFGKMIFDMLDTDPDGSLTFSEFLLGISQICERASSEEKAMFCFKLFDKNRDRTISKQEFINIVSASLEIDGHLDQDENTETAVMLFNKLDKDQDGEIDYSEFRKATEMQRNILKCVSVFVEHYLN